MDLSRLQVQNKTDESLCIYHDNYGSINGKRNEITRVNYMRTEGLSEAQ